MGFRRVLGGGALRVLCSFVIGLRRVLEGSRWVQ